MKINETLKRERRNFYLLLTVGSLLALAVAVISLSLGAAAIPLKTVLRVIFDKIVDVGATNIDEAIIIDLRLPRILSGLLVGAGLSISGVVFQAVLKNPLADPYTIGVSTGAAFGAVLAIYLGLAYEIFLPTMPVAFFFALVTLLIILKIAGGDTLHSSALILAGIIVGAVLSAGIGVLKSLAGEDVSAMIFWLMGRLMAKSWLDVAILFPIIAFAALYVIVHADDLDLLTLGAAEAQSLGLDVYRRTRSFLIVGALLTAVCVAISGIIGFIGLVVPHMIRMFFSAKHRYLLPLAAVYGGLMLMLADNISRLMFRVELPVGVITTLIGGPFFIYIYSRTRGQLK